ncbi:MAG: twin-arginine translocation signal domain-containing protein [Candidatus Limnocylindrales bacterium]
MITRRTLLRGALAAGAAAALEACTGALPRSPRRPAPSLVPATPPSRPTTAATPRSRTPSAISSTGWA